MFRQKTVSAKSSSISCSKGIADCMYASNGGCSAEWCIFEELPKMVNGSKSISCDICGSTSKTVSVYSGINSFICDDCKDKIKKIMKINNCIICGASTDTGTQICSTCASKIKEKINE